MLYEKMFGECHAHLIMDGLNYKDAISIHKDHVNDEVIRKRSEERRVGKECRL